MQNEKLRAKLTAEAVKNGITQLEWLGGSLYVKFQGSLPHLKADKTHLGLRKVIKAHDPYSGVNMFEVGEEFVYDFVPLSAETPDVRYDASHVPPEVDEMITLESEIARGK